MAQQFLIVDKPNPTPGREGGIIINENFTELYTEGANIRNTRARVRYTSVMTATYVITDNELVLGHNIFGVNYAGIVLITLPAGIDSDKLITINDESGQVGTNKIFINVA